MQTLWMIGILLFSFNLAFAIYNLIKYPIRGRKGGRLVMIFYILTIILCLSEISRKVLLSRKMDSYSLLWTGDDEVDAEDVLAYVIYSTMIEISVQVIVNMFQVRVAIQKDLRILSASTAEK